MTKLRQTTKEGLMKIYIIRALDYHILIIIMLAFLNLTVIFKNDIKKS